MGIRAFLLMGLMAQPAIAQEAQLFRCSADDPQWDLTLSNTEAQLTYAHRATTFEVPLATTAENRDWPRAFTLIAEADSAIVLLEKETCGKDETHRAHVLTQRGQTPILLTGCCRVAE